MRRLPTVLTVVVISAGFFATGTLAASRSEVANTITQACGNGGSGCMAAVDGVLSQFGKRCRVEDRAAAQGLADAVMAISQTNTDLAVEISKQVVVKAKNCFQVAFGEVLDGTGTASVDSTTENGPESDFGRPGDQGSPG